MKKSMTRAMGVVALAGVVTLMGCGKKAAPAAPDSTGTMGKSIDATTNGSAQLAMAVTNAAVKTAVEATNLSRKAVNAAGKELEKAGKAMQQTGADMQK